MNGPSSTLESHWQQLVEELPIDTPEQQIRDAQKNFYSGVAATLTLLKRGVPMDTLRSEVAGFGRMLGHRPRQQSKRNLRRPFESHCRHTSSAEKPHQIKHWRTLWVWTSTCANALTSTPPPPLWMRRKKR